MASNVVPKNLYKRLLRSAKTIDNTNCQTVIQSILCGKPSTLYSYELKKNIEIGTSSYSLYDRLVSIMNDGEYSSPTHPYPVSFYSIIQNTARLCFRNTAKYHDQDAKFSILSKYCRDIKLTKSEFHEIVSTFDSLATIAVQYKESQQSTGDKLTVSSPKNAFQCDVIDWMHHDFHTDIVNILLNKQIKTEDKNAVLSNKQKQKHSEKGAEKPNKSNKKPVDPLLEYVPKTFQVTQDTVSGWRNSILFQHPLSTMSRFNANDDCDTNIEPYILLGLHAQATHSKLRLTGQKENSIRLSIAMNGERTLMNVEDALQFQVTDRKNKNAVCTFHGYQAVPEMFMKNSLFLGGNDLSSIEILTINPYCKGISALNNRLFWNPDLKVAERIISSGYGTVEQFRFFKGKMKWNSNLWNNVQDRNIYGYISTVGNTTASSATLLKQMWGYHAAAGNANDKDDSRNNESLWYTLLEHCFRTNTKDIGSWLHLFTLLNQSNCNVRQEIYQLMQAHDAKIGEQVRQWQDKQQLECS